MAVGSTIPFVVSDIFLADKPAASAIDHGTHLCSASSATGSAEQRCHHTGKWLMVYAPQYYTTPFCK